MPESTALDAETYAAAESALLELLNTHIEAAADLAASADVMSELPQITVLAADIAALARTLVLTV